MVVEAHKDPIFNTVVRNADIVTPDGKPVALFMRLFKGIKQERVCGLDIFPDLLREAEQRGKAIFFYGSTDDILQKIKDKASVEYPLLNICGVYSPPFRHLTPEEESDIVSMINSANPDLICIALGCPKQENWMAAHMDKVKGCMLGLGHAFNVYAGQAKRSPKWMQDLSMEWAYRLYQEPQRLWKRYFVTNTIFLLLTARYSVSSLFGKSPGSKTAKAIYKCEYHVVWVAQPGGNPINGELISTIYNTIPALCQKEGCAVKEINVNDHYVHLTLSVPPEIPVSNMVSKLKDKVAGRLVKTHPQLNGSRKRFWKQGYLVTTDLLNEEIIQRYVRFSEHQE
jgi:N-acetylglucosaminyldiphosphoundecaprenol N-acetyl-beta-D-mannosaminyltransferase